METLTFLSTSRDILEKLHKQDPAFLLKQAALLLERYPEQALVHYVMALCLHQKGDIPGTLRHLAAVLQRDPSFVSAAELLLELNKDNYSIGELKYLYSLIAAHKAVPAEGQQYLRKFPDVALKTDLSVPENGKSNEVAPETLPGSDDDAYIRHLLDEMEHSEKTEISQTQAEAETVTTIEIGEDAPPLPGESITDKKTSAPAFSEITVPAPKEDTPEEKAPAPVTREIPDAQPGIYQAPRKQAPPQNNKPGAAAASYSVETLTMAQLYMRQGLYEYALDILLKLQKRDPGSERIRQEIDRVKQLMNEEIRE
ncbi:MAG: hypothetical protein PHX07_06340 [Candidatus Marinimicrobia bacterium]|jgi:tetratricopeptide (TPR) repeat protein|nr:hypothetical protein [Candidatus Neomarinimicrobiota bacterium]MDD4961840.1 hypothetical protein [Candidatus Neomarinimicrobiota bacterium]MDD5709378.1 hypothetical protein [Candidatus Neomarinimicrobiota bacterium]MDX9777252.1 hypothetical protein [bacterium]